MKEQAQTVNSRQTLNVYDLGFSKDYGLVWEFQKELLNKRINRKISDCLVVVEHDHVFTLGRSSHLENVLVKDLPIFEIERGGDVTYHGPGQLVVYPIVSLQERNLGVRQFIETLEASIIDTVSALGITGATGELGQQTGVWIDSKRKIASIGVAVSHWVTYHGLALNVNTDLSYFQKIRPCGFESGIMTSISKEKRAERVDMNQVKELLVNSLSQRLGPKSGS
jgi:lipoyl(octanoyl) transferase